MGATCKSVRVKCNRQCKTVVQMVFRHRPAKLSFFYHVVVSIQLLFNDSFYQVHNKDFAKGSVGA